MQQQAFFTMRAGRLERIPVDRSEDGILDLSTHFAAEQSAAMMTAPGEVRKETARLLTELSLDLEAVRDAIKIAISSGLIEEAISALEELRDLSFVDANHVAPIVRTAFTTRRAEIARELHALLCAAYEKLTGRCVEIERRA
ncbi:hypothetical protein GJ654_18650 [Rhodoblastus acidophilus]|uniref:Uncharacterized protein n=1 Tax=Rhodoblastus acidophilus TaxID=1074 RepID=A0A6N8DV01_RHOAC|nr:hypothetical protein [Rhodoblastus acidophilus]MCW2276348.1 hypothetical protein [Rhodoblastus acidophilus]MTV33003.1 hypothetical protein [Rhodoblastus acidophilus]